MSDQLPSGPKADLASTKYENGLENVSFGLLWISVADPRILTPRAWQKGSSGNVFLKSGDERVQISADRYVTRLPDGTTEMHDEIRWGSTFNPSGRLDYEFDSANRLAGFPKDTPGPELQEIINAMTGLVNIPGSIIRATSMDFGIEAEFVSDGKIWVDIRTGNAIHPALSVAQVAIEASEQ